MLLQERGTIGGPLGFVLITPIRIGGGAEIRLACLLALRPSRIVIDSLLFRYLRVDPASASRTIKGVRKQTPTSTIGWKYCRNWGLASLQRAQVSVKSFNRAGSASISCIAL